MKKWFPAVVALLIASISVSAGAMTRREMSDSVMNVINPDKGRLGVVFFSDKDTLYINHRTDYPLMSVFKLHQAIATCRAMERDGVSLDSTVVIPLSKLNEQTWSPILKDFPGDTIRTTLGELFRYALIQSDNNASNWLFDNVMSVADVDGAIAELIPRGEFALAVTEGQMFRDHSLMYRNHSSPYGCAELIGKLYSDPVLQKSDYMDFVRKTIEECTTGLDRIVAPLLGEQGVTVGHKTGSGFRENGILTAHNDVAFVRLPDGRTYTLAILITDFKGTEAEASRIIARISALVYDFMVKK